MIPNVKANQCLVVVIEGVDAATLEAAVNTFLEAADEAQLLDIQFQVTGSAYVALITYMK